MYDKYLKDLYGRCIHILVPDKKSPQSTMDNGHCPHIWHIPLSIYGCKTVHICSSALLLQCTYRVQISTNITQTFSLWYKQSKSNRHKCEKINMTSKCKLTITMPNSYIYICILHVYICAKSELATTKTLACGTPGKSANKVFRPMLTT